MGNAPMLASLIEAFASPDPNRLMNSGSSK
jgi:hypothetical protein